MDVLLLLGTIVLYFFGPVIVVGLLVWGFILLRRSIRLKKSLDASKGDEAARALELLRIKATMLKALSIPAGLAGLVAGGALFGSAGMALQGALFTAAVFSLPLSLWSRSLTRRYNAGFKDTFVTAELAKTFDALDYKPEEHIDPAVIGELGFFNAFDGMQGDDLISAQYKGIRFEQSDMRLLTRHVTTETVNGETKDVVNWAMFFRGRAMRFDFVAPFRGEVQVVKRNFEQARVMSAREGWERVETELAALHDDYEVFAKNPLDAMAVLTPRMIEGIYYLDRTLQVPLALYFKGNSMFAFIALARDTFDASAKKTLLEEREFLQKDIALVTNFLETMYFKKQEGIEPGTEQPSMAEAPARKDGAGIPLPPPPVGAADSLRRAGYTLDRAAKSAGSAVAFLPLAIYAASVVYMLVNFPDGVWASYSSSGPPSGDKVPTWGYVLIGSFLIVPSSLGGGLALAGVLNGLFRAAVTLGERITGVVKGLFTAAMVLIFFWLHLLFLSVNMTYG